MKYWVYIACSKRNGTLYIGVTNNINRRIYEHKNKLINGFSSKYKIIHLVYVEEFSEIQEAIYREKKLKKWNRAWKIQLIESLNPNWEDLSMSIL